MKNKQEAFGWFFLGMPIIIFLGLFLMNFPRVFTHCWLGSCAVDIIAVVLGIASMLVGTVLTAKHI